MDITWESQQRHLVNKHSEGPLNPFNDNNKTERWSRKLIEIHNNKYHILRIYIESRNKFRDEICIISGIVFST